MAELVNSSDKAKIAAEKAVEEIQRQAKIDEAYLVGLLWSDPFENYSKYSDGLEEADFLHPVWGFFFDLGSRMYSEGVKTFDTITIKAKVRELNIQDEFDDYGGLKTINDAINIVGDNLDNIEYYHESVQKNKVIQELWSLFGDKVFVNVKKYNWKKMNKDLLARYWNDKSNKISLTSVSNYEAANLYIDGEEFIQRLEDSAEEMLPFHQSYMMNKMTQGIARGHVFMFGGFGGKGKSSIMADKFVMSCITNQQKLMVVLNEEDIDTFRQKIVLSILSHEFNTGFDRKRMVNGQLRDSDKELIKKAFDRMNELINGQEALIKVIFMERYVMKDLEKIVKYWANRGYENLLIDTHKVSDDSEHDKRWETFVEDMKTIYRLTRKNAGGLNLRTVVTFQLSDGAIRNRYLDFTAMAEGRAAKNEASVVMMFRPIWSDEYPSGKKPLDVFRHRVENGVYKGEEKVVLDKAKTYYLFFLPKNRFGADNENGQEVLVVEPVFGKNSFYEKGWTRVDKDYN